MGYKVENLGEINVFSVDGFFTFQDMDALTKSFDEAIEKNPNAKVLMDFSAQTGYEEATIKAAFHRIDQGFPRTMKMAIVYEGEGSIYKHVLNMIAKAIPENAQFFSSRTEAESWLNS